MVRLFPFLVQLLCLNFVCGWIAVRSSYAASSPRDWVLADLADGELDEHDLFTAGIILSGATQPDVISGYQTWLEKLAVQSRAAAVASEPGQRAIQVLELLHDELLTGDYEPGCGDLRVAFDDGKYNCATATILYQALARRCGLVPRTIALPGHVRCALVFDGQTMVLETTQRTGRLTAEYASQGAAEDAMGGDDLRELTDVQLLAKLLYNQGLGHLASSRFSESLAVTELSWQLDQAHEEARQNVAAVVNNWALHISSPGTYEQAIGLLRRGQRVAPDHGLLAMNERHMFQAWLAQAIADGDNLKAVRIRKLAAARYPQFEWVAKGMNR